MWEWALCSRKWRSSYVLYGAILLSRLSWVDHSRGCAWLKRETLCRLLVTPPHALSMKCNLPQGLQDSQADRGEAEAHVRCSDYWSSFVPSLVIACFLSLNIGMFDLTNFFTGVWVDCGYSCTDKTSPLSSFQSMLATRGWASQSCSSTA